jgi:hypothetical protein
LVLDAEVLGTHPHTAVPVLAYLAVAHATPKDAATVIAAKEKPASMIRVLDPLCSLCVATNKCSCMNGSNGVDAT